jgi:hypothetical protein
MKAVHLLMIWIGAVIPGKNKFIVSAMNKASELIRLTTWPVLESRFGAIVSDFRYTSEIMAERICRITTLVPCLKASVIEFSYSYSEQISAEQAVVVTK